MLGFNLRKPVAIENRKVPIYKRKKFWLLLLAIVGGIIAGRMNYSDALRQSLELFMDN